MKTSECLYCGMLTSSENSICETCDFAVSAPQNQDDAVAGESNNYQETSFNDFGVQQQATPENSAYSFQQSSSQSSNNNYPPRDFKPPRQTAPRTSCVICHRQIPAGQRACFTCGSKKLPVKKFATAFAVLAVLAIVGIGVYAYKFYLENSPLIVLKKYATATGADKMSDIQNLTFKGKVNIKFSVAMANTGITPVLENKPAQSNKFPQVNKTAPVKSAPVNNVPQARSFNEIYSFEMIMQNPNKSFMAFFKTDPSDASKKEFVYKQAFDGFNGWKYAKMFDMPPTLEDVKGDSGQNRPEMFLDNYESVEYLTEEMKKEYGEVNLDPLMSILSYSVDGNEVTSKERVAIQVVKNNQKTLLIFDKESSLLLAMLRKEVNDGTRTVANIYVDNYKTATLKGTNSENISVLMPGRWKFEMHNDKSKEKSDLPYNMGYDVSHPDPSKVNISMSMTLDIETAETGPPAEDKIFFKPLSLYTAENNDLK